MTGGQLDPSELADDVGETWRKGGDRLVLVSTGRT